MQNQKPKINNNFFQKVYKIVKTIPKGKITTYGKIAENLGTKDSRKIGWALHANKSNKIPCHRVVNKNGRLARNFSFDGWQEQKRRLLNEGIIFESEICVDVGKYLWIPK